MAGASAPTKSTQQSLLTQLDEIEHGPGGGVLTFPGGRLEVSNLGKVFWPAASGSRKTRAARRALTKGDLFRHYVRVAPMIRPVLADRPLVMKRFPNGITGPPFYQHRAPDKVPEGVRIERVATGTETRPHLVGGSLTTLLYTAQLGSISQDPWFSRA
jgi:bifunctional non-homologous end joining protein LigD